MELLNAIGTGFVGTTIVQATAQAGPGDGSSQSEWGEEPIADELSLKLGIPVSSRTGGKYLDSSSPCGRTPDQHWTSFARNHAKGIVACDFVVSVTASLRALYAFAAVETGSRRVLHANVTAHPTAEWTLQQFCECLAFDHSHKFVIHDRDAGFSTNLDSELKGVGLRVLKTPVRALDREDSSRMPRFPDPTKRTSSEDDR